MTPRLLAAAIAAGALAGGDALGAGHVTRKTVEATDAIEIPEWKLDLVTGQGDDWWIKHARESIINVKNAIWGNDMPDVTASPAQDRQHCPVLKLPQSFTGAAKHKSWRSLSGEWSTGNNVNLATWEQNYLTMGFSRNVKRVSVFIRTAATGQIAIRTRPFTDEEMWDLFNWKAPGNAKQATSITNVSNSTTLKEYTDFNIAIFDCASTLMYVVKERTQFPKEILVYSRDGSLVSKANIGHPVLRYQFVDPSSGYLIATAEAPGINASVKRADIPRDVEVGDVLPFGFHYELGGYTNSSALMETEYRWVLATVVQALAIYKAELEPPSWTLVTVVEAFLIVCIIAALLVLGGFFFCIYRCIYPGGRGDHYHEHYYGRLAENPFLAHKDPSLLKPIARKDNWHGQELGWHGGAHGYGAHT